MNLLVSCYLNKNINIVICSQMQSTFEEDFPAIFEKKRSKKMQKRREKDELNKAADLMSARTYQIMVSALEDLVSSKKVLLMTFRIWKDAVGMVSSTSLLDSVPATVTASSTDEILDRSMSLSAGIDDDNTIYTRCLIT